MSKHCEAKKWHINAGTSGSVDYSHLSRIGCDDTYVAGLNTSIKELANMSHGHTGFTIIEAAVCFILLLFHITPVVPTHCHLDEDDFFPNDVWIWNPKLFLSSLVQSDHGKPHESDEEAHRDSWWAHTRTAQRSNAAEMISRQYKPERNRKNCLPDFCPDILRRGQKFCPKCYLTHQCQLE